MASHQQVCTSGSLQQHSASVNNSQRFMPEELTCHFAIVQEQLDDDILVLNELARAKV